MQKITNNARRIDLDEYLTKLNPTTESEVNSLSDREKSAVRRDVANYVERMSADLSLMSNKVELHFIAYLLDMVRIEAADRARENP